MNFFDKYDLTIQIMNTRFCNMISCYYRKILKSYFKTLPMLIMLKWNMIKWLHATYPLLFKSFYA